MDNTAYKKEGEELQNYLRLMRKHNVVPSKKAKALSSASRKTKKTKKVKKSLDF